MEGSKLEKSRPVATKKRIEEYRSTAPELTDVVLKDTIEEKYGNFFIDNGEVAAEAIKEAYREELPLTLENIMRQLERLVEERKLLKYHTELQYIYSPEAKRLREKVDNVIEQIYNTACKRVFDLSELADEEAMEYFINEAYKNRVDMTLANKLNNLCCNYHCRKYDLVTCCPGNFPPFKCFDWNNGKDVTFAPTFEEAKAYHNEKNNKAKGTKKTALPKNNGCMLWIIIVPSVVGLLISIL